MLAGFFVEKNHCVAHIPHVLDSSVTLFFAVLVLVSPRGSVYTYLFVPLVLDKK